MARRWMVIVAILLFLSGCSSHAALPPEPQAPASALPNWPDELAGMRFRWAADPGIDLTTGPAVPVRAYVESYRVGFMTKSNRNTYPGFDRAVPELPNPRDRITDFNAWQQLPFQLKWIWPAVDEHINSGAGPFFGNEYFRVIELSPLPDGYLAYVCDGRYDVFHPRAGQPGRYWTVVRYPAEGTSSLTDREKSAIELWRIEFRNDAHSDGHVPPQEGTNPAPLGDVFGHWRITGASTDNFWGDLGSITHAPEDPDYVERLQHCRSTMPQNLAERATILTSVLDSPPPAQPAVPGWPNNPA